jgi:hypothetical protein
MDMSDSVEAILDTEIRKDSFTIEAVTAVFKSQVDPLTMILWPCKSRSVLDSQWFLRLGWEDVPKFGLIGLRRSSLRARSY